MYLPKGGSAAGARTHRTDSAALDPTDDVAQVIGRVGRTVRAAGLAAYAATMIALVAVVAATTRFETPEALPALTAAAGAATVVAWLLLHRMLRHVDALHRRSMELTHLYDRARFDALRDGLTGLGNHRAFQEELERATLLAKRQSQSTALLLIDVDDLKRTNDAHGHEAGDEVLQSVARAMLANLRRTDRAFRIGGDEFAILSPGATPDGAAAIGRRILAAALNSEHRPGLPAISVTIGISAVPRPSADRGQLYRHADAALYWGKRHGRTDVQTYDPQIHGAADDDRPAEEIAAAIDRLIEGRLLTPVFQPVFSLRDGACVGFEGLVRPDPVAGFRGAGPLFVAAESVNRTVELDLAAVRGIALAARDLSPDHYLAINLSPRTVEATAFNPHEIIAILNRAGVEPRRLLIELTEREAIEDMDQLLRHLAAFRRLGVRIAVDDVGAGNAGLQLLSRIEFDVMKIDLSLVQTGTVAAPSRSVVRALIEMANRRGATTVAEGIETPLQLEALRELGIQVGQGYLLGRPRAGLQGSPVDIDALLARIGEHEEQVDAPAGTEARRAA